MHKYINAHVFFKRRDFFVYHPEALHLFLAALVNDEDLPFIRFNKDINVPGFFSFFFSSKVVYVDPIG